MNLAKANSVLEMLDHWAKVQPEKIYARFLVDGEVEGDVWTFAQMRERSLTIAAELASIAEPGDRALLVYPQGLEFIAAYFGCLYAGIIAVPVVPPASPKFIPKLFKIIQDCEPACILTTAELLDQLSVIGNAADGKDGAANIKKIAHATDTIATRKNSEFRGPNLIRDDLAFLQYTSGSTGSPKGVMVSHGNLLANAEMIHTAFGNNQSTLQISWAPHYHDMGLIGACLTPGFLGSSLVLMSPFHFVQSPVKWLNSITKYKATLTGGPNFGYELCTRKVTADEKRSIDLSTLKVAFNGAEPIRAATLQRFQESFLACGFNPSMWLCCYGLAESTLLVSGGGKVAGARRYDLSQAQLEQGKVDRIGAAQQQHTRSLVGCGAAFPGQDTAIVDPNTFKVSSEGAIGEMWVSGPHVAKGYWNRAGETLSKFNARVHQDNSDSSERRFLRTGDLVALAEGELIVCGRLKDLIIHNGRNVYPQDIEEQVESCSTFIRRGCVIAFGLDHEADGEGVGVVAEIDKNCDPSTYQGIGSEIRASIGAQFQIPIVGIALIRPGSLPKTSSGKLQRREARQKFLDHSLELIWTSSQATDTKPLPTSRSAPRPRQKLGVESTVTPPTGVPIRSSKLNDNIDRFLVEWLALTAKVPVTQIAHDGKFTDYGLDSVAAIELQAAIKKEFGIDIPDRALFDYSSVRLLSQYVEGKLHHHAS